MKKTISSILFTTLIASISVLIYSCSTDGTDMEPQPEDPCDNGPSGLAIGDFLHSFTGQSSGRFQVNAMGGNGNFEYSIDGENFTTGNVFTGLSAGNYTITVVDDSSCTATLQYEVKEFLEVSFANDVLPIINANCQISPCHGTDSSLPSWSGYSNVKARVGSIRLRVTSKAMPPPSSGGSLSDQQILTIQNWIDVGAPDN